MILEQIAYQGNNSTMGGIGVEDLAYFSATALYSGPLKMPPLPPIMNERGERLGFGRDFGLGTGVVDEVRVEFPNGETAQILERFRAGQHEDYGRNHVNLEYFLANGFRPLALSGSSPTSLANIHVGKDDD